MAAALTSGSPVATASVHSYGPGTKGVIALFFVLVLVGILILFLMMTGTMPGMNLQKASGQLALPNLAASLASMDLTCNSVTAANGINAGGVITGSGITATTTGVTATAGGVTVTAGDITATAGNITATAGAIAAKGAITAGGVITGSGITATTTGVTSTGGVTAKTGNIVAPNGSIQAGEGISATGSIWSDNSLATTGTVYAVNAMIGNADSKTGAVYTNNVGDLSANVANDCYNGITRTSC